MAEQKPKKIGRPTKYRDNFPKKLLKYFLNSPKFEEKELPHYDKDGNLKWVDVKRFPGKLPTFEHFANYILDVSVNVLYEWCKKYPEFLGAFTRAKEIQKDFIIENGSSGLYNPTFTQFVAKNITDMRDVQEVHGKQEHEHRVIIIPERKPEGAAVDISKNNRIEPPKKQLEEAKN